MVDSGMSEFPGTEITSSREADTKFGQHLAAYITEVLFPATPNDMRMPGRNGPSENTFLWYTKQEGSIVPTSSLTIGRDPQTGEIEIDSSLNPTADVRGEGSFVQLNVNGQGVPIKSLDGTTETNVREVKNGIIPGVAEVIGTHLDKASRFVAQKTGKPVQSFSAFVQARTQGPSSPPTAK